jgi:hypothetical protein
MNEQLVEAERRCLLALAEGRTPSPEDEAPLVEAVRAIDPRPEVRLLLLARLRARREAAVERARRQRSGSRLAVRAGSGSTNRMSGRASSGGSWLIEEIGPPTFSGVPLKEGERDGLPAD